MPAWWRRRSNAAAEKAEIEAGRIPEKWKDKPAKLAQNDRDALDAGFR